MSDNNKYISLSELQRLVRCGIDDAHPLPYWVAAEISELKVNYSGHCYIDLIEKGGDKGVPKSRLSAVIWSSSYKMISAYFASATGRRLEAGINILVKGMVTYHELYGLSFQITDIEPSYTLGDMQRQRQQTIDRLTEEGVLELNKELDLPIVLQRLAVVSSATAAGYQDFCRQITANQYGYFVDTTLFQAVMQGDASEKSIIAALESIAERMDEFDAVVIIRGGGSQSDLGCFDSYELCNNIAQFPLPVITGIGHDKDVSIADMVANTSLKTPTATAVFIVDHNAEFESGIERVVDEIMGYASEIISAERELMRVVGLRFKNEVSAVLSEARLDNERRLMRIGNAAKSVATSESMRIGNLNIRTKTLILNHLKSSEVKLDRYRERLAVRAAQFMSESTSKLDVTGSKIDASDPTRILSMGYAMLSSGRWRITSIGELEEGKEIKIYLKDGIVGSEIKHIAKWQKKS